ncbi:FAS1 domain-containing protein [Jimgerdemannia flammicorona]|uniref:FAS1 domain-containing protein n=1 Tax=Jimgerdemannia flammicorona TaxID=994334 RepID=A0A433D5A8_9FUNG|nr:FAS1 domain-containing protein [Jimgerdemannia flammicorona]
MQFKTAFAILASMAASVIAQTNTNTSTIIDLLRTQTGQTDQFATLLSGSPQYQNLITKLSGNGSDANYTVFAPNNAAITKLGAVGQNVDLTNIILYHILNGSHPASSFSSGINIVSTLLNNGSYDFYSNNIALPLVVSKNDTGLQIPYSTNETANVTQADLKAMNGIVHIIDSVLSYPISPSNTIKNLGLNQLYMALNSTNSTGNIDTKKGVTIFAPNDKAFGQFSLANLNASQIQNVIGYHVVDGVYFSPNLTAFTSPMNLTTQQGKNITVKNLNGGIEITDVSGNETAKIVRSDILTNNGVIHIIDVVLIPSENSTIPNNTSTNFTNTNGKGSAANSLHGAEFSFAAFLITVAAAVITIAF